MTTIALAKPAIDVGLMTNDLEPNMELFQRLGVDYDHLLKVGGGIHQHRYACGHSVIKLNSHRAKLSPAGTGFGRLRLAGDVDTVVAATTVDGVQIDVVPAGHDGIVGVELTWSTSRPDEAARFLELFGATAAGDRYQLGESVVVVEPASNQRATGEMNALGFRYVTVQVFDVEAAHAAALAGGFREGRGPVRLGDTAYISFVRDTDGNWIELSQRASLTGPLPDVRIPGAD